MSDDRGYAALDELEAERVRHTTYPGKREKLEYALESLHDANDLKSGLDWKSELWADCTVGEVLGALLEAEAVLNDEARLHGRGEQWIIDLITASMIVLVDTIRFTQESSAGGLNNNGGDK